MSRPKPRTRTLRARQREQLLGTAAKLLGCAALIAMVASVFYVVISHLWETPHMEEQFLDAFEKQSPTKAPKPNPPPPPVAVADVAAAAVTTPAPPATGATLLGSSVEPTEEEVSGIESIETKLDPIAEAVRAFFQADSIEDKTRWVRDPERVLPLMEDYYSHYPLTPFVWKSLGWAKPIDEKGYRLGYVQAQFEGTNPVQVIIEEEPDGTFRVDWESSVRYGELSWRDFLSLKPTNPTLFRLIASRPEGKEPDPYSTQETLELRPPGDSNAVTVTFNREDPQFAPLLEQLQVGGWKNVPVTLRLYFSSASLDRNRVEIASIEGKGWLILQKNRS